MISSYLRHRAPALVIAVALAGAAGCKRSRPTPAPPSLPADEGPPSAAPPARPPQKATLRGVAPLDLMELMKALAAERAKLDPSIAVEISPAGSETGIDAVMQGTADLTAANRRLTPAEGEAATKKAAGQPPKEFVVAHEALCVYVHKDNPLGQVDLAELRQIFGKGGRFVRWSDLGVKRIPGAKDQKIVRVQPARASIAQLRFGQQVLGPKSEEAPDALEAGALQDLTALVAATPGAIAYAGDCKPAPDVRLLPVSGTPGRPAVAPTPPTIADGSYPLAHHVLLQTLGSPSEPVKRYLDWELSESGQRVVEGQGYTRAAGR